MERRAGVAPTIDAAMRIASAATERLDGGRRTAAFLAEPAARTAIAAADRLFLVALGKVAAPMARAATEAIGPRSWTAAIGVTQDAGDAGDPTVPIPWHVGSHPFATEASDRAGRAVLAMLDAAGPGPGDLVIACISGGTSALAATPRPPLAVEDLGEVSRQLLLAGVDVTRINAIRGAVSDLHAGGLLRATGDAPVLALILCDNVQIGAAGVGSGPTFPRGRPPEDAFALARTLLPPALAARVAAALEAVPVLDPGPRVTNVVVGDPATAAEEAGAVARALGHDTVVLDELVAGEATAVAPGLVARAAEHLGPATRSRPTCVVAAGEVTVTVRGRGSGGRCQELALAVAAELGGPLGDVGFVAFATDGCDFLPGVGGGWVTGSTWADAHRRGLEPAAALAGNDSHAVLGPLGQCLPAIPARTNVCDLYVFVGGVTG